MDGRKGHNYGRALLLSMRTTDGEHSQKKTRRTSFAPETERVHKRESIIRQDDNWACASVLGAGSQLPETDLQRAAGMQLCRFAESLESFNVSSVLLSLPLSASTFPSHVKLMSICGHSEHVMRRAWAPDLAVCCCC